MSATAQLSDAKRRLFEKMLRGEGELRREEVVTRRNPGVVVPASAEQLHVWLHASMAPELPLYNESITIHRHGSFDLGVMEASLNEMLRRHTIWRTGFVTQGDTLVQAVDETLRVTLPLIDLTSTAPAEREAAALRIAQNAARTPFDLSRAPLFRAVVVKLGDDEHRLYLTLHHIIFDGVSIYRVLVPELAAIYAAFAAGIRPPLAEPRLQYADYAVWQGRHLASDAVVRQMDHWRSALSGELPVITLPCDRPRPAAPSFRGSMEVFHLPSDLIGRLKLLSREAGVTLYMTLFASFATLLHRYSGQGDVIVGGVTDTRRRPELEGLMGYFLNTIALRTKPSPELPFRSYLSHIREVVLGALAASEVPFDQVVRELHPRRDTSRHPLFQVLFSIEPPAPVFPEGWDLTQMDVTVGASKFDLYLELDERPDSMHGRFMYNGDLFDAGTIRRMIGHWTTLLGAIAANPDDRLGSLALLTEPERRQIGAARRGPRAENPPSATVHELVAAQARQRPDAPAVKSQDGCWSYRQLDEAAERLAEQLRGAGVGRGTLVGLQIERGPWMVAGLLAILKAGGHYLPLDAGLPPARLQMILEEAQPPVLLTDLHRPEDRTPRVVHRAGAGPREALPGAAGPDDLAYLLYTSGSTGRPKGVEVPHGALVNFLLSMQREPGFGPQDRLLSVTTLSFDIAGLELFLPLISGGSVFLASREAASDPRQLAPLIRRCGATVMQATPTTWRALVESGWAGAADLRILCGGEALTRKLADDLLGRCAELWNLYGPTETTIWSTLQKVRFGEDPVPIGRPIANTSVFVLDAQGQIVPAGVPGELYIGGDGVARGYRGRPDLTEARFVARDAAPEERLYRTGDLVRCRADGVLEWLGRIDSEMKIRGVRVAPEEVETAILRHADIAGAAVRPWQDASGQTSLAACVVMRAGIALDSAALRAFLQQHLPDAMVPSRIVALAALPLTPNGKIDRKALPEPEPAPPPAMPVQPQSATERRLCDIWSEVLGVLGVGINDDFFDLGGHSLLAAKLLHRIEVAFGRRLRLAALFQAPTVEQMAKLLEAPEGAPVSSRLLPIQPEGTQKPLFWLQAGPRFRPLAEALGKDRPFLGVALDPEDERGLGAAPTVEQVAAAYVRIIRAEQPEGPYFVGGWCTAGIVAYEAGCQLAALGQEVGLIVLVHAVNPVHLREIGTIAIELSKAKHHLGHVLRRGRDKRWSYAHNHFRDGLKRATQTLYGAAPQQSSFSAALVQAAYRYRPAPSACPVALFQPADRPAVLDYRPGWRQLLAGEFAAYDVPGTHRTMLEEPSVRELAARLTDRLARRRSEAVLRHASE
jgi:amino acid adenylation domain-containing protein